MLYTTPAVRAYVPEKGNEKYKQNNKSLKG